MSWESWLLIRSPAPRGAAADDKLLCRRSLSIAATMSDKLVLRLLAISF